MAGRSYIEATAQTFKRFVLNGPREYTTILFVTMNNPQCQACMALDPAFDRVAATYQGMMSAYPDNPLLFVRAEISHLQEYYNILTTKFQDVPQIIRLPPTSKSGVQFEFARSDMYQITTEGMNAKGISDFIQKTTGVTVTIVELPWQMILITISLASAIAVVIKFMPNPLNHLRNPYLYMILTFVLCAANFGGTPFNLINNPPFIYSDPYTGKVIWYIRAARSQLKLEGLLIGASVIIWAMSLVGIQEYAMKQKHPGQRAGATMLLFAILVSTTLFVHFLFKEKYGFYPY
eukprot:TRINITY_DN12139_c0_g1_i1.p1 TRINITY_DN12139_c0_g1~~TRINITY_DN12139_c0_g1_i1.p1  ORF type:complete len:331 (+),score=57.31 TRINITY_DN12139_c0_g1_i1:122-994(+)